jgi:hypothetical protein
MPTSNVEAPTTSDGLCDGYCPGDFPYGCSQVLLDGVVKYMCLPNGGCYYALDEADNGPYDE